MPSVSSRYRHKVPPGDPHPREITGYSREQLEATNVEAITHPDDLGTSEQALRFTIALVGDARPPVSVDFPGPGALEAWFASFRYPAPAQR